MTEPVDFSKLEGWKGEDLPDGVQGLIVTRKFAAACAVMAGNLNQVYQEISAMMDGCDASEVSQRLNQHPFYRAVMEKLAHGLDNGYWEDMYRYNAKELYDQVRDFNTSCIMSLAFALWVTDGADIPDGLIEVVKKVEEADKQNLLNDLTGEEE